MVPHPCHMIEHLDQRRAGYLAESAHERRARLAEHSVRVSSARRCADFLATLAALVLLTLLAAAGTERFIALPTASTLSNLVSP